MPDKLTPDHHLKKWKLLNPVALANRTTSDLYLVDSPHGKAVLKIFTDVGIRDELPGTEFLHICNGNGCVKLLEHDQLAQLLEYLPGSSLFSYSQTMQEPKATQAFIQTINKIHRHRIPEQCGLAPLDRLLSTLDTFSPPNELETLFKKARLLARQLLSTQTQTTLLHGDLHHENVLQSASGQYVCIDPKGMTGDPAYELGPILTNPWGYPEISHNIDMLKERANTFSEKLQLPLQRILGFTFVHLCLAIMWSLEDDTDFSHPKTIAQHVDTLL